MANYSLNIENLLEYLSLSDHQGEYLHEWLGLSDERAHSVSLRAYNIVWDNIEEEGDFNTIATIKQLFTTSQEENYNDVELFYYLYWGISEIDGHINPAIEINFESETPDTNDISLN
jgi:uncharacterized protein Yka (UPF0111/DUF47 family)